MIAAKRLGWGKLLGLLTLVASVATAASLVAWWPRAQAEPEEEWNRPPRFSNFFYGMSERDFLMIAAAGHPMGQNVVVVEPLKVTEGRCVRLEVPFLWNWDVQVTAKGTFLDNKLQRLSVTTETMPEWRLDERLGSLRNHAKKRWEGRFSWSYTYQGANIVIDLLDYKRGNYDRSVRWEERHEPIEPTKPDPCFADRK
jgi:hypothetical protein